MALSNGEKTYYRTAEKKMQAAVREACDNRDFHLVEAIFGHHGFLLEADPASMEAIGRGRTVQLPPRKKESA